MNRNITAALALTALMAAGHVSAATCETTVEGNDGMQFNTKEIVVDKSCKKFTVHLKHVGKTPKQSMGHNWVLTKAADMAAVNKDGQAADLDNQYVKKDDARVIAHTKVIGGGETDSVTFDTAKLKAGDDYEFFCSFPGHAALMKGKLKFQ